MCSSDLLPCSQQNQTPSGAEISPSHPRTADRSAPSTTCIPTTPTTVKSSEPFEKDASVDAPSATTEATAEEDMVADAGMTVAHARSGATGLVRTSGRTCLVKVPGVISLARIILREMLGFLHCRHQEGTTTTAKTMGLGASKSLMLSSASWEVLRPRPPIASSSSLLAR